MPLLTVGQADFTKLKREAELVTLDVNNAVVDSLLKKVQPSLFQDYPELLKLAKGGKWKDEFARNALTPTGFPTIYTTNGTLSFVSGGTIIRLQSGAVIGNSASIISDKMGFARGIADITSLKATIVTQPINALANGQFFVGIYKLDGALGSLPTTTTHAGVQYDSAVSPNWRRSTASVIQEIATSSVAYTIASHKIVIEWLANAVNFSIDDVSIGSNNTNLPLSTVGYALYAVCITQEAIAKFLDLDSWKLEFE